jgi:hypothetical protein
MGRHAVKFWILVAAVIGYHFLMYGISCGFGRNFVLNIPFTIFVMTSSPGRLFFRPRLLVGLTNALVYGVVAYTIALGAKKLAARRSQQR